LEDSNYSSTYYDGWTRTNAVVRLENGNTLVCLCNFHFIAELDTLGNIINKIGEGLLYYPHDPEVLGNGNILVATQKSHIKDLNDSSSVLEIDPKTNEVVWRYENSEWFDSQLTRDANRLSNGNTLITGSTQIIEVTPTGEIVWRLKIKDADLPLNGLDTEERGFYKSQRIAW
jgi:outer membrane protein assembly factor BamB